MSKDRSVSSNSSLRVLVAEDNELNRKVTLAMLDRLGHKADIAVNGIGVLRSLEHQQYDIILMNICMPLMDGIEATIEIRRRYHNGPKIVAVTAYAFPSMREKCLEAGMNECIIKPMRVNELVDVLANCQRLITKQKYDLNHTREPS
jgi:CheY-like chemotaxis protein